MQKKYILPITIITLLVSIINIGIFIFVNTTEILWTHNEMLWYGSFWSTDEADQTTLKTGFSPKDLIKPFNVYQVDGTFRTRQLSYFMEMLSFKFWQKFNLVFLRDYTLILIHLVNTLLLWILIFNLTHNKKTALISSILFLNSGAALASLLFPFRNAKMLVIGFFLLVWIILARNQKKFTEWSLKAIAWLFFLCLCALFIDENAFFILPLPFFYLGLKDKFSIYLNRKFIFGSTLTIIVFLSLFFFFRHISVAIIDSTAHTGEQLHFLKTLGTKIFNPEMLQDVSNAFLNYFLRRNFGHWDKTWMGMAALSAFILLCLYFLKNRFFSKNVKLALAILFIIFAKAILLPHNGGYHDIIMPKGTVHACLLFFSFYYVYVDSLLMCLIIGLLLNHKIVKTLHFAIIAMLITVINASNAVHLKEGPQELLKFFIFNKDHKENPQGMIKKIRLIDKLIADKEFPVYLSFPQGHSNIAKSKRNDPFVNLYARIIPIRYLSLIEKGEIISSYKNIKTPFTNREELATASYFYDLLNQRQYNLNNLRNTFAVDTIVPLTAQKNAPKSTSQIITNKKINQIVFFIKGNSAFRLQLNDKVITGGQIYGQSYQIFNFDEMPLINAPKILVNLTFLPIGKNEISQLVGPFIFTGDETFKHKSLKF